MSGLTEKRLATVLGKADHRYKWYCETYPWKARNEPGEASKRWWEALATAMKRYESNTISVKTAWEMLNEEQRGPGMAYLKRAKVRWGI